MQEYENLGIVCDAESILDLGSAVSLHEYSDLATTLNWQMGISLLARVNKWY